MSGDKQVECARFKCSTKNVDTLSLHAGWVPDGTGSSVPPVYRTSSYIFKSAQHATDLFALKELGNIYTRLGNPTQGVLESRMAVMEGSDPLGAVALSSGTSAVFYSVINLAQTGDNIICAKNMYGGTATMFKSILPREFGIECKFVDMNNAQNVKDAINSKTRCVFGEVCANPSMDILDIEAVASVAHAAGLPLVVDATFCTPALCRPLDYGADVVVHSMTKWLSGHGNAIGGIVIDGGKFNWAGGKHPMYTTPSDDYHGLRWGKDLPEPLLPYAYSLRMRCTPLRNLGACISPDNAWMFLQGMQTLTLRMEKHCSNALAVAEYLNKRNDVAWVRYGGLPSDRMYQRAQKYLGGSGGGIVVFELKGGKSAGLKFIESVKLFHHLANVGDARSLAIHPASTTHSQLSDEDLRASGISGGMVRLSVGIENPVDIIADLEQALATARSRL